LNLPYTD